MRDCWRPRMRQSVGSLAADFEHELVHLREQLCWETSECAAARFQDIATRHFRHRAHTHHLITPRERAAGAGISIGHKVSFEFEGRRLVGRVHRVTKRVSVLVEDGAGFHCGHSIRGTRARELDRPQVELHLLRSQLRVGNDVRHACYRYGKGPLARIFSETRY